MCKIAKPTTAINSLTDTNIQLYELKNESKAKLKQRHTPKPLCLSNVHDTIINLNNGVIKIIN